MVKSSNKKEIYIGMVLIGTTGVLIGLVTDSPLLMGIAGSLGMVIGGFIGWIGGRRCRHGHDEFVSRGRTRDERLPLLPTQPPAGVASRRQGQGGHQADGAGGDRQRPHRRRRGSQGCDQSR